MPNSVRALSLTSGLIGNGKVKEILMSKPLVTVLNKPKRIEERITETLYRGFKVNGNQMRTKEILGMFETQMQGFDKYLVRDVLRQLAVKKSKGLWVLRFDVG